MCGIKKYHHINATILVVVFSWCFRASEAEGSTANQFVLRPMVVVWYYLHCMLVCSHQLLVEHEFTCLPRILNADGLYHGFLPAALGTPKYPI